jgi:hypothetical protein
MIARRMLNRAAKNVQKAQEARFSCAEKGFRVATARFLQAR